MLRTEFCFPFPVEHFLPRMLRTLSLYFLGLILKLWDKKNWNISSSLNLVKYYTINKFYEAKPITNKKGHQKWKLLEQSKKHWHTCFSTHMTTTSTF